MAEILAFRTPRVHALFPGWSHAQVLVLTARAVLGGVAVATQRGVLLALWRDPGVHMHVYAIFGERGFLDEVRVVWRDLWPEARATGGRRGRVRHFNLSERKRLWEVSE